MPAVNPNNPSQGGPQRTTFRPPWVKEGPNPLPMPSAPWTARGREAQGAAPVPEDTNKVEKPGPRKLNKVTIIPSQPAPPTENNAQELISQANLKWNPKAQDKKQDTVIQYSKPQSQPFIGLEKIQDTPVSQQVPVAEKKQDSFLLHSKPLSTTSKQKTSSAFPPPLKPVKTVEKTQEKPASLSKVQPPELPEKEVFSQAKLKWNPKPKDKKQEAPPLLTPTQTLQVLKDKKKEPPKQPLESQNNIQITQPPVEKNQEISIQPILNQNSSTISNKKKQPSKEPLELQNSIQITQPPVKKNHEISTQPVLNQNASTISNKEPPWKNVVLKKAVPAKKDQDSPTTASFNAKRPSAFLHSKEGPKRRESNTIPVVLESSKRKDSTETVIPVTGERRRESVVKIKTEPDREPPKAAREFAKPTPKPVDKELPKSILKDSSKASLPSAPKPPPPPPMAPPMPPPPPPGAQPPIIKSELTPMKVAKLEALRSRPRRRPDWTDMMKEVEEGRKLRHVQCNDRSAPILPQTKAKGQFVYESEKDTPHDPHKQLLNQIQRGVKLKRVKTNDRSKPILDGLRKFRRQMTIEEQIQKSMSMADVVAAAAEPDELDDIDKVRDDLQSTKQMLALELRNKEALERENKRLMARLLNLEVELEKEKNAKKTDSEKGPSSQGRSAADEKLVQQLKEEAAEATRVAKEMEEKYHGTAEELDATRAKLESAWLRNQQLELELKTGNRGITPISKQPSSKKLAASTTSMPNGKGALESEDESEYTEETETETESEEEPENEADAAAIQERRIARELKMLSTKLRSYKDKQALALKERHSLREQLRKQQKTLRQEKKKYKALQKEVDKMAKLMKDDEEEEEEEEEKPEELEEEETESESESDESEEDDPTDGDLPEEASVEEKRKNLTDRSKHHENRLGTLKKGNYLLKANIDRLQDDINRQREMSLSLQEDLNSVLAELG